MHFDLTDLELFLHVAETGSITAGAQRSKLALASASTRIKGLEDHLAAPLLTRGRRGVTPTAAGRTLIHHARQVLSRLERMREELDDISQGLRGTVRLWCGNGVLAGILPDTLDAFLVQHPDIDIDIEERPDQEILAALAKGLADMGIVTAGVNTGGLETFPCGSDRLALVAARGHPLAELGSLAFADVLDSDCIGPAQDSSLWQRLEFQALKAGKRLKHRVRSGNFETVCRMAERKLGVGLIPLAAAHRYRKSMDIQVIPLKDDGAALHFHLCMPSREGLTAPASQLLAALRT